MDVATSQSQERGIDTDRVRRLLLRGGVLIAIILLLVDLLLKLSGLTLVLFGPLVLGGSLTVSNLLGYLTNGLIVGMTVGLAGIGLSMTYSILNFANFAHGDTLTVGAFVGWAGANLIAGGLLVSGSEGLDRYFLLITSLDLTITTQPFVLLAGAIIAALGTILLTVVIDRLVYRPMRDADGISLLIASIGVALALRYLIAFVWDKNKKVVTAIPEQLSAIPIPFTNLEIALPITITLHELTLLVTAGLLMLGVHLLLQRTKLGTAMRAMADNESLARVSGIPTERIIRLTWIIGGGLTGVAGYLFVLESGTIIFNFGWTLLLLIFAAVILGGIGSIYGAMAGGVLIGMVDKIALIWLPTDLTRAAAFLVIIAVLLIKPDGIFGGVKTA